MDIFTIGHTTLDTFVQIPSARLHSRSGVDTYELCLNYGDKLIVDGIQTSIGGNAANAGVGLGKMGFEVGLLTYLGQDESAEKVIRTLKDFSIQDNWVTQLPKGVTDQSVVLNFKGERTILAYHHPWIYKFPGDFPRPKWVYLTSINENFLPFHQQFLLWRQHLQDQAPKLAYNPGVHELKAGLEANSAILKESEVLILNQEEAEGWVKSQARSSTDLLKELQKQGPKMVVITDAKNGSFAFDGQNFYRQEAYPAKVVEKTGAGDAFSAGLLGAFLDRQNLQTALKWGSVLSANVIKKTGATNGLLTKAKLLEILRQWTVT